MEESIEKLKEEVTKLKKTIMDRGGEYSDAMNKISELNRSKRKLMLQNIADIKSLQNLLGIFANEAMTHREKEYMSRHIYKMCDKMVTDRITELEGVYSLQSPHLPF